MDTFAIIGLVGVGLLLFALLFDGLFDGLLPDFGWLSLPSLGAALAGFGLCAWVLEAQADVPVGPAIGIGALVALVTAMLTVRMSRAAMRMTTDSTPTSGDLLGTVGRVITPIADSSTGEVMVRLGGQPVKLTASTPDGRGVPSGTEVVVVGVVSSTRVTVEDATSYWSGSA